MTGPDDSQCRWSWRRFSLRMLLLFYVTISAIVAVASWFWYRIDDDQAKRIKDQAKLVEMSQQFRSIPLEIGEWSGEDISQRSQDSKLAAVGRVYTHAKTCQQFTLWLVAGHPRYVCAFSPATCDWDVPDDTIQLEAHPTREVINFGAYIRKSGRFSPEPKELQIVLWSMSIDGTWDAPRSRSRKYSNEDFANQLIIAIELDSSYKVVPQAAKLDIAKSQIGDFVKAVLPYVNTAILDRAPDSQTLSAGR